MNIQSRHGLPFAEAMLLHKGKSLLSKNFLIATGSGSTLLAADVAVKLDLEPKSNDIIREIGGAGGFEYVYEKRIESIKLGAKCMNNCDIEVGGLDYGLGLMGSSAITF